MYSLYLDKPTLFECDVSVKNANLKNAFARMIVETDEGSFLFKGNIKDGRCNIPIKIKGLLTEQSKGKMQLEIVVEDTYFVPWKDDFKTEEHTSVKVQVKEQKEVSTKPMLEVKVKEPPKPKISQPAKEIIKVCERFGINRKNIKTKNFRDFKQLIKEYFRQNIELKNKLNPILNEVLTNIK